MLWYVYVCGVLWTIVFFLEHRGQLRKRVAILLAGVLALLLLIFLWKGRVVAGDLCASLWVLCSFDLLASTYAKKRKQKTE